MKHSRTVLTFGELVVDSFPDANGQLVNKFGGAPGNTAIGLASLGVSVRCVGKVGADALGDFLGQSLRNRGVVAEVILTASHATTNAVISLDSKGERSFTFHGDAHQTLTLRDVASISLDNVQVLHFCSMVQATPESNAATMELVRRARDRGIFISYDPNIRMAFWESEEAVKEVVLATLPYVDLLKIDEEELGILAGTLDYFDAKARLWQDNMQILIVTLGAQGAWWVTPPTMGIVPAPAGIKVVDTTGAGDAFNAALIYKLLQYIAVCQPSYFEVTHVEDAVAFATAMASLSTQSRGAVEALPTEAEIYKALGE